MKSFAFNNVEFYSIRNGDDVYLGYDIKTVPTRDYIFNQLTFRKVTIESDTLFQIDTVSSLINFKVGNGGILFD